MKTKCGGEMGNTGCVSYMFSNKGLLVVERTLELEDCIGSEAGPGVMDDERTHEYPPEGVAFDWLS